VAAGGAVEEVGDDDGLPVGEAEGLLDGEAEGLLDGDDDGLPEGEGVGDELGSAHAVLAVNDSDVAASPAAIIGMTTRLIDVFMPPLPG
jgi:hypothetical protein